MLVSCLILSWIAVRDLRDHIITNKSLFLLSCSLLISFKGVINLTVGAITFIILILISTLADIGGGDIKLITTLVLFAEIQYPLLQLIALSTALASIHLLIIWITKRKISARIALAPSICIPMIYSMLLH
jgi:Flp pilus assembly protein protease CpaA